MNDIIYVVSTIYSREASCYMIVKREELPKQTKTRSSYFAC